jgi:hypothetical protein
MVLTVPVRVGEKRSGYSRRSVLRAALGGVAAAVPLVGCDDPEPASREQKGPDPLSQFYRDTAALLARFEAAISAVPSLADRLAPLRDDHRAHLDALAREIGPGLDNPSAPPTATGAPTDAATALTSLLAAEKEAAAAARAACLTAPSYRAALLGSIAAARASHAEVLT